MFAVQHHKNIMSLISAPCQSLAEQKAFDLVVWDDPEPDAAQDGLSPNKQAEEHKTNSDFKAK